MDQSIRQNQIPGTGQLGKDGTIRGKPGNHQHGMRKPMPCRHGGFQFLVKGKVTADKGRSRGRGPVDFKGFVGTL